MSTFQEILGQDFNAEAEAQKAVSFDPIPAGQYNVIVDDMTDERSQTGGVYYKVEMTVLDGEFEGRKIFDNINVRVVPKPGADPSKSKIAEEIGKRTIGQLLVAAGKPLAKDSAEVVGAQLRIRVKVDAKPGFDPKNRVTEYKPIGGTAAPAAPQSTAPASAPAPKPRASKKSAAPAAQVENRNKMPWEA